MILSLLNRRQALRGGYLTEQDLRSVAYELNVELSEVQGLVSFYPHFHTEPPPKVCVQICQDMNCHLRGSRQMTEQLTHWADEQFASDVKVKPAACLGRCDRAPAAFVNENLVVSRSQEELKTLIRQMVAEPSAAMEGQSDSDMEWAQHTAQDWSIDVYAAGQHDYLAAQKYVTQPDPQAVIDALERSRLLGMGGAGARTYLKWQDVRQARGSSKYIIGNADESEPGTFKDRDLMLRCPHLIIEGMLLAGLVVGAERGWIWVRHEYQEQVHQLEQELHNARSLGALGRNVFGSIYHFDIEVVVSPGSYIVGEQTALVEALEGRRAEPRIRPPELMTNGYKNQPTLLNNVETFAWVPAVLLRDSGQWFAEQGYRAGAADKHGQHVQTELAQSDSKRESGFSGRRFFSVSGDIRRPGVYELPVGLPLGELLDQYCGGMLPGKQLVALALSGASGGLLPPKLPLSDFEPSVIKQHVPHDATEFDLLSLPLDIQVSRQLNIMLGAGIVVYGTGADVLEEALACSRFFRDQSCGKCVPCRIGAHKITEMGELLAAGQVTEQSLPQMCQNIVDLSQVMQATSICGLGQVASNPLRSVLAYFPLRVQTALDAAKAKEQQLVQLDLDNSPSLASKQEPVT